MLQPPCSGRAGVIAAREQIMRQAAAPTPRGAPVVQWDGERASELTADGGLRFAEHARLDTGEARLSPRSAATYSQAAG
jgi:hypothetical protein